MMRFRFAIAFGLGFFGISGGVRAQDAPTHALDGGTRETLISIDIAPVGGAPFLANVVTEWTRVLPDGSTQTNWNHRTVARDGAGRVFQERRSFAPDGDKQVTPISELDFEDPYQHEVTICRPSVRVCTVYQRVRPATAGLPNDGPLPGGTGTVKTEDLGRRTVGNLELVGSRQIVTLNAGVVGNQRSEPTVKEFWYSPYLKINVITKRFDPHASGIDNFEVKDIQLTEPDAKLFDLPDGYRVVREDQQ